MSRIYVASKTKHQAKWRALKAAGEPIISTWIDLPIDKSGNAVDHQAIWRSFIHECVTATAVVLYVEPGEVLKGGLVEIGAALGAGVSVFYVGDESDLGTFAAHPRMWKCNSVMEAMDRAKLARPQREDAVTFADWLRDAKIDYRKSFSGASEGGYRTYLTIESSHKPLQIVVAFNGLGSLATITAWNPTAST
jgi:hypothetical protein